jgi:hypothetical protein
MAFSLQGAEALAAQVAQAREQLAAGDVGKAKALLEHVVYNTHDPELLRQIHELGQEGIAKSGRFGRSAWKLGAGTRERREEKRGRQARVGTVRGGITRVHRRRHSLTSGSLAPARSRPCQPRLR